SCDDNPGGDHFIGALAASTDLAWGEGYPDYWQSAVRAAAGQPYASHYLDINGSGTSGINVNLEATQPAALVSVRYEMAIAAALWDLFDAVDDDQDIVTLGHAPLQAVYTGDEFEDTSFGYFDDTCTFDTYMKAWVAAGEPTDALTAAAIAQNTGYTLPPQNIALASSSALESQSVPGPTFGAWWNEMTYVVDRSKSMAGARLDAVKAVLAESINDLSNEPGGTEFSLLTLDSGGYGADPLFAGQFFPERLTPVVNGLSASATADNSCENTALSQFYQAMVTREGGQAWLFTDGVPVPYPNAEAIKQALNEREINASVALLAGCDPAETSADLQTADATGRVQMEGALTRVLGETAAAEVPQGIVPYLLMAINSGGRFLYVDPAQIDDAAAILRAQITHSAGAGTWSDYVSDQATYRWQELASWEYSWIDAAGTGTNHGQPASNSYVDVPLPNAFTYFGAGPYSAARAYEKGYFALGSPFDAMSQASNTTLPNTKQPNNTLYPYWDNLDWVVFCMMDAEAPDCTAPPRGIYSKQEGQWFAIEQKGYYATSYAGYLDFQTQLNLQTGEIRFLYNDLDGVGAPSATIGLENAGGTSAVQVSYNDVAGAADGMGYKFIPAPPQPTRTFTAVVDQHMDGIAFLLTGYSGTFEDLLVKTPDGQPISCADTAAVYCLDLGLVQYVQANVNGRYGEWQAVVDA
ncbi:MAG: hypothetical protein ACK2UK_19810, partial [Candidatus Promineifilaceae bacterium]